MDGSKRLTGHGAPCKNQMFRATGESRHKDTKTERKSERDFDIDSSALPQSSKV